MDMVVELVVNYLFLYLGKGCWRLLKFVGLVSNEFGTWGYVALGFSVFLLLLLPLIFLFGAMLWR